MSASEKLKALEPDVDDVLWGGGTETLWDAHPQIVAVVEALERVIAPWDKINNPAVDEALAFARDALAALDEALT